MRSPNEVTLFRLGLNEYLYQFLVELNQDRGLFLQSFGNFWESLFNDTPLKISRRAHSILACLGGPVASSLRLVGLDK